MLFYHFITKYETMTIIIFSQQMLKKLKQLKSAYQQRYKSQKTKLQKKSNSFESNLVLKYNHFKKFQPIYVSCQNCQRKILPKNYSTCLCSQEPQEIKYSIMEWEKINAEINFIDAKKDTLAKGLNYLKKIFNIIRENNTLKVKEFERQMENLGLANRIAELKRKNKINRQQIFKQHSISIDKKMEPDVNEELPSLPQNRKKQSKEEKQGSEKKSRFSDISIIIPKRMQKEEVTSPRSQLIKKSSKQGETKSPRSSKQEGKKKKKEKIMDTIEEEDDLMEGKPTSGPNHASKMEIIESKKQKKRKADSDNSSAFIGGGDLSRMLLGVKQIAQISESLSNVFKNIERSMCQSQNRNEGENEEMIE